MYKNDRAQLWLTVILHCAILNDREAAPVSDSTIESSSQLLNTNLFQGDVMGMERDSSPESNGILAKNGIANDSYQWPKDANNSTVSIPYVLSPVFEPTDRKVIQKAMKAFAGDTCIRFTPRTTQPNYLNIKAPPNECSSYIGRMGGEQTVHLSRVCLQQLGVIEHELMHALGFYHEQARGDRDLYVDINYANIAETDRVQFANVSNSVTFDQEYDFASVMHYEKYSFAIDKTVWTIRLKEKYDSKFIGQRLTLSPTDIRKINRMYNCEDIDPEKPPETISTPTTVARTLKTTDDSETNTFTHALATTTKNNLTKRPINVTPVEVANNNTATNMLSCISESYAGHCEDDDNPACNQACQNDSRGDGKCGPFRSFKICYCDGCPGTKERRTATEPHKTGGFLVFAQGSSLWKLPVEDRGDTEEITNTSLHIDAVAVDCGNHHLYWTIWGIEIRRSRYDGSNNHLVVSNAEISGELAVDFVSGNMFWFEGSAIFVAKMSHLEAGHKTLISNTGTLYYAGLAVHPSRGSIYWSRSGTTIETASMDGINREVLVTGVWADSLALDYEADDLYWADANTGNVECISLNGGGKRIVYAQKSAGIYPYSISLSEERVYWTSDDPIAAVNSVNKSGSAMKRHSLPVGPSRYSERKRIVIVPEQCPKLSNACAVSNGGCPFICLPLPGNNKKCLCPDGNSSCTS